jgi:hypothetical protein
MLLTGSFGLQGPELLNLAVKDVRQSDGKVRLVIEVARRGRKPAVRCALSKASANALRKWITMSGKKRTDYVFSGRGNRSSRPMTARQSRLLRLWVSEAGLNTKKHGIESLRRTKAGPHVEWDRRSGGSSGALGALEARVHGALPTMPKRSDPIAISQAFDILRRIGVLMGFPESDSEAQANIAAFRDGLQKLGWTEGRNIRIDPRWATPADAESMQRFAKELVATSFLSSTTPTTAALQQTRTIPIVFETVADPVGSGFVASFPQPGGNATGFVVTEGSLGGKWLELLKEIAPHVAGVAMLFNPSTAPYAAVYLNPFKAAAASLGWR